MGKLNRIYKNGDTSVSRKRASLRIIALTAVFFALFSFFAGCSMFSPGVNSVKFRSSEMYLNVGDRITINETYLSFNPSNARDKSVTLESDNPSIISVKNNQVTAVSVGEATLSVTTNVSLKTASCTVIVSEVEIGSIRIIPDGERYQTKPDLSYIKFYADFNGKVSLHKPVEWTLKSGGQVIDSETVEASKAFGFFPEQAGLFSVSAKITNSDSTVREAAVSVYIYEPSDFEPVLTYSGDLTQAEDEYSPVEFSLDFTDSPENPARVIEWRVNGREAASTAAYSFTPQSAGEFTVEAFVCGRLAGTATVVAEGGIDVKDVVADFDNYYPEICVSWSTPDYSGGDLDFEVLAETSDGTPVASLNSVDNPERFEGNSVIFSGISPTDEYNIFNTSFTFKVKSLQSGRFSSGDYAVTTVKKVSGDAREYLADEFFPSSASFAKNYYISDEQEFAELLGYYFMWRSNPVLKSSSKDTMSKKLYAGYGISNTSEALYTVDKIYGELHITGLVSYSCSVFRNVVTLTMNFLTDGLPTKGTTGVHPSFRGGIEMAASRPHIDYDSSNTRSSLPIENSNKFPVNVSTSEQLYYVATQNFRPVPESGTKAEELFNYAKNVLLEIINNNMNDFEKAHAIYDWLMWKVNYDYILIENDRLTLSESVKYNAYYLDGVFSDSRPYAVCDGIVKAYALMCNMENIECIRVAGDAGNNYDVGSWSGHAWNKVKIDGEWYIVDATWGDECIPFAAEGISGRLYELASHKYFLLTDKQVEKNRIEASGNYPRTALTPYNWYDNDINFQNKTVDFYINCDEKSADAEAKLLADYIKYLITAEPQYKKTYSSMISGYVQALQKPSNFAFFDVKVSKHLTNLTTDSATKNQLISSLRKLNLNVAFVSGEYLDDYILYVFIEL